MSVRAGLRYTLGMRTRGSSDELEHRRQLAVQRCLEGHILKELTKAVLHVAARPRKKPAAKAPKLPRRRPPNTPEARRKRRRSKATQQRVAEFLLDLLGRTYCHGTVPTCATRRRTLTSVSQHNSEAADPLACEVDPKYWTTRPGGIC
jgi:hypothetical protein